MSVSAIPAGRVVVDTPARRMRRRLLKNKPAVISAVALVLLVLVAILAPYLAPQHYAAGELSANFARPSERYP